MGNQQPSNLEQNIRKLAINAVFGDGYLWKHPECKNYKAIWSSISPELLEVKRSIEPTIFSSGVKTASTGNSNGRFENAKPLHRLASTVHPIFTEYKSLSKDSLFSQLTVEDFGLWYLDDGCCVRRKDTKSSYRFTLSIGDCCNTPEKQEAFESVLISMCGSNFGRIYKNNSRATVNNMSWIMTKSSASIILDAAKVHGVLPHKFPS
jgi:hypothetical protein